jgi:hypothetical protein
LSFLVGTGYYGLPTPDCFTGDKGCGWFGRASGYEGTLHLGPVAINGGAGVFDTGIMMNKGFEVKLLGNGGKIDGDGLQICVATFCGGMNWPWNW